MARPSAHCVTALLIISASVAGCASGDDSTSISEEAPPAAYPDGPYGLEQDDVIGDLQLVNTDGETVALKTFHQGEAGALLLYVTATWCFTCGPEIGWLNDYAPRVDGDLVAMSVLLQNKQFEDATAADALEFSDGYGAQFPTVLDPSGELDVFREEAFVPLNLLIDTDSMRITLRETGFDEASLDGAISGILEKNQ